MNKPLRTEKEQKKLKPSVGKTPHMLVIHVETGEVLEINIYLGRSCVDACPHRPVRKLGSGRNTAVSINAKERKKEKKSTQRSSKMKG